MASVLEPASRPVLITGGKTMESVLEAAPWPVRLYIPCTSLPHSHLFQHFQDSWPFVITIPSQYFFINVVSTFISYCVFQELLLMYM